MAERSFTARLDGEDWDSTKLGWRCPALDIPGSVIIDIFFAGQRADKDWYKTMRGPTIIKWIPANPPEKISVVISLDEKLSLESDTIWWKRFAVIVPIIASIGAAVVTGIATNMNGGGGSIAHNVQFSFQPTDKDNPEILKAPSIIISGKPLGASSTVDIKSDVNAVIDSSDANHYASTIRSENGRQLELLKRLIEIVNASLPKLDRLNQIATARPLPGGNGGQLSPYSGEMASIGSSVAADLSGVRSSASSLINQSNHR